MSISLAEANPTVIKARDVKADMTVMAHNVLRADTWTFGDLTVEVSRDVRYGQFQSWDDASCYIHGVRDDGATYPLWIWDLADVTVLS